jgi:hypothetical protein
MKAGNLAVPDSPIRQYIAQGQARRHVEAIVEPRRDVRQTYAQLNAGTKSNVTAYVEDAIRLTPSGATGISHTTGTDDITDLDTSTPDILLAWALDESAYGADLRLTAVQLYLDIQRDTANAPFDGFFALDIFRIAEYRGKPGANDFWALQKVASSLFVNASDITAAGLVSFSLNAGAYGETAPHIVIDGSFVPNLRGAGSVSLSFGGRVIVIRLTAFGGTNTNYSWKYNSATSNPETVVSKGTLYNMSGATPTGDFAKWAGPGFNRQVSAATGIPRVTFTVSSFAASGSWSGTLAGGNRFDLGATPTGDVEFRLLEQVPPGCSTVKSVRALAADPWTTFTDGQTAAELGLDTTSRYWEMKWEPSANASQSASPTLKQIGALDRVLVDLTEIASMTEAQESVDPLTGQMKIGDAELYLLLTGDRDYLDLVTRLLAENNWKDIEIRTHAYHPNLTRDQWGLLDLWTLDDAEIGDGLATLKLVSVLALLRGKFPAPSGSLYGYLLKIGASDLTSLSGFSGHVGDFYAEMSPEIEATSSRTWNIAAGAIEYVYLISPAGVPGLRAWGDGPWTVNLNITAGNASIKLAARIMRISSAGALLLQRPQYSYVNGEEVSGAPGARAITVRNVSWAKSSATLTDRVVIEIRGRNTDGGAAHSITFETGTIASEIRPSWIKTEEVSPQQFSAVTPAAAAATWLDSVIGLPAKYRGALSDRAQWLVSKSVMDADGQRELERMSFLDGLTVIASQGVLKQVNLWGPRGLMVGFLPMEVANVQSCVMGFASRLPEYVVGYGFETNIPNDFAGTITAKHDAAFTAFGRSKIDEPIPELEHETAKYILDPGLAGEIARARVLADGCGDIRITTAPVYWHPEWEIGDDVAVEVDRIAFKDPVTGNAIRGIVWAPTRIIGKTGDLWPRFEHKVWGLSDLFVTTDSVQQRAPNEGPRAIPTVERDPAALANAKVRVRAFPSTATIYYYVHDLDTDPPARDRLDLWSTYTDVVTVARDASVDRLFTAWCDYSGFVGGITTVRIPPDATPTVISLSATQAGAAPVAVTASTAVDSDVREVAFYRTDDGAGTTWPTIGGGASDPLNPALLTKRVPVSADGAGTYRDGTSAQGGLTDDGTITRGGVAPTYASTRFVQIIVVGYDYNGNISARKTLSYDVTAGASVRITAASWSNATDHGASCLTSRTYDFAWTPSGVVDGTHTYSIYCDIDGIEDVIYSTGSPNSVTSVASIGVGAYGHVGGGNPDITARFRYELTVTAGGALLDSGAIGADDVFQGQACDLS